MVVSCFFSSMQSFLTVMVAVGAKTTAASSLPARLTSSLDDAGKPGSKVALDKSHFRSVPEPPSPKMATQPSPECTGKANPIVPPAPVGIRIAVPEILG